MEFIPGKVYVFKVKEYYSGWNYIGFLENHRTDDMVEYNIKSNDVCLLLESRYHSKNQPARFLKILWNNLVVWIIVHIDRGIIEAI